MGRYPCCKDDEDDLKKGAWTEDEDEKLIDYINKNGHTNWKLIPRKAGIKRCGKSCRLRWNNYLRPNIKRGGFSNEEEEIIINLHSLLGNKWSKIAANLPGRTDNEIKNFYNSHIRKKLLKLGIDPKTHKPISHINSLINISNQFTFKSNYFASLASTLRLQAQFTLLAKIQQLLQNSPISSINTNLFSSIQGNFSSNPIQGEIPQLLNFSQANFTTTTPCFDNTTNTLPKGDSSISNSLEIPYEKFGKIETIQKKSALPLCKEDTQKSRNGANSSEFFRADELNSSTNQVEGLVAWSSRIDSTECSLPNDYSTISNSSEGQVVHLEAFDRIETIQSRSTWLMCNDDEHKSRNGPNSSEEIQANDQLMSSNHVEGLAPSTSESPKFSELDDIGAWDIPQDDEDISFFWNTIFQ